MKIVRQRTPFSRKNGEEMSPQSQAQRLVEVLTPYLPFLLKGREEAAERVAAETWRRVLTVWHLLEPKLRSQPATLEALQDAAVDPGDSDAKAALRLQVRKLLSADVKLARQVDEAFDASLSASTSPASAAQRLLELAGTGLWEGDLSEMREDFSSRREPWPNPCSSLTPRCGSSA